MTSKFVAKCKQITVNGQPKWIIRMRMTLRGFQDWNAHLYETYAGTASRLSQKVVCSEVACRPGWTIATLDVEKAFLQGMSYDDIRKRTGEPLREVYFTVPQGSAEILRLIPGYERYDERYHCLQCLVPGTGTADAPRAFNMKLTETLHATRCGYKSCTMDPEVEFKHGARGLEALAAKHVDDIKVGGLPATIKPVSYTHLTLPTTPYV